MLPWLLLVDDDPQIVRAILPALQVSGLNVTVATSASEAIERLDERAFDALVVDLGLPDRDGKDVVRHLRSESSAPIIVISARTQQSEVTSAINAGANEFLHKPFATPTLVNSIVDRLQ